MSKDNEKIIGEEREDRNDESFITRAHEKPGYINKEKCAGNKTQYEWAELKSSALVYFLNKNNSTHSQLLGYLNHIIYKVLSYLNKNIDVTLEEYQEKLKTTPQKDPYYIDTYPVAQVKAYISSNINIIKGNFYMMYNFLLYIWYSMTFNLPGNSTRELDLGRARNHINDCTDEHLTVYFIVQLFQQGIMNTIEMSKAHRINEDKYIQENSLKYDQSKQIGISNIVSNQLKRKLRDFPDYEILSWLHPGRTQCRVPYRGKYGKYIKEYTENNEYEASLQCGISSSVQFLLYMYLISIAKDGTRNPKRDVRFTLISAIMVLVGDGGHNIREIITGFTLSIILLYTFMVDLKRELRDVTGKKDGEFANFNITEIPNTNLCSYMNNFIKFHLKVNYDNYNQQLTMDYLLRKITIKKEDKDKVSEIKNKGLFIFNQLLFAFSNWENYIKEFYEFTKYINPLGVYTEDLNKYDTAILTSQISKQETFNKAKQSMYNTIFIKNTKRNIDLFNMAQIFFSLEGNRYELDPNISFKYSPNNLVNKTLIDLSDNFKDILKDVNLLVQTQIDNCKQHISSINIPLAFKSTKSKMIKRKSPKRKSPKRKSPKRKSPKRKSPKRKSPKRKSPKRKSPKRKSPKRKSPKRKSPKRKSPKRKSMIIQKKSAFKKSNIIDDIKSIEWYIFTKNTCDYCNKAKKLLEDNKKSFISKEITEQNKEEIYNNIDKLTTNYRYFPIIFHNGKFIGGYTELKKDLKS